MRRACLAFTCAMTFGTIASAPAAGAELPKPGSPDALVDWRGLARRPISTRHVVSDARGTKKLASHRKAYVALNVAGPGVLDHFWTADARAKLAIEVDDRMIWQGTFLEASTNADAAKPFPKPIMFAQAGMYHLLAPIGYRRSLRVLTDKATLSRYLSYRTFPKGTRVALASADPKSQYARGLAKATEAWKRHGYDFRQQVGKDVKTVTWDFVLQAGASATALRQRGSGEITSLEFHINPPLVGSLRNVVAEITYDGAAEPALRLPITDLVGLPHPWPAGRWHAYNGDLAGGIRYPWMVNRPRFHYPEVTFHLNLPIPFADGIQIHLVNRSDRIRFAGYARAVIAPLSASEARRAGRLCGKRDHKPVKIGASPRPLLTMEGPGHLVGLGLFLTGCPHWPPAATKSRLSLSWDGPEPITGMGLMPLWFRGSYSGAVGNQPIWNHPLMEDNYTGLMRHFLTDPVPFKRKAIFAYTPGTDATGAPTEATVVALWYRFSPTPYVAPALAERAETLPHSRYPSNRPARKGPGKGASRVARVIEAEDLAAVARVHGGEASAIEDVDHNYHPSRGSYLRIVADQAGDYVDCPLRMPASPYVSIGWNTLWGPNRGQFEIDLISKERAKSPPTFPQGYAFFRGRAVGSVAMKAPIYLGHSLGLRRDPGTELTPPFLNPAPDDVAVLRFICQTKGLNSASYLLKIDQLRIDLPPRTVKGWREFEGGGLPATEGEMTVRLPKYGQFYWSGWGATLLSARPGGKAVFRAFVLTGVGKPSVVRIRGCLSPDAGTWQARCGKGNAVTLTPGTDGKTVVTWDIPVKDVTVPGPVVLEFTCTGPAKKPPRMARTPEAAIALDAWMLN